MEKNFEIGQVVFILSEERQTVVPGIIVEESIKRTINGNTVSWKMKVGPANKAEVFDTSRIKGEVYGTIEEVKVVMAKRLNEYIEKLAHEANERLEKWYGKEIADRQREMEASSGGSSYLDQDSLLDDKIDPNSLLNSIESSAPDHSGGVKPSHNVNHKVFAPSKEQVIAQLKSNAIDPPSQNSNGSGGVSVDTSMFITGPNGERIPVNVS